VSSSPLLVRLMNRSSGDVRFTNHGTLGDLVEERDQRRRQRAADA